MTPAWKPLAVSLAVVAGLPAAQETRTFTGVISDDVCARSGHAAMRMGPTDAECTIACVVAHGAVYVLLDDEKRVYVLSDQQAPEAFAGQRVLVTGVLDAEGATIRVDRISAAPAAR